VDPSRQEINIQLLMVFAGLWDEGEVPMILQENGLITEAEETEICERFEDGESSEAILLPFVHRAFFQYFRTNAIVN
jgi:hypothetical protein